MHRGARAGQLQQRTRGIGLHDHRRGPPPLQLPSRPSRPDLAMRRSHTLPNHQPGNRSALFVVLSLEHRRFRRLQVSAAAGLLVSGRGRRRQRRLELRGRVMRKPEMARRRCRGGLLALIAILGVEGCNGSSTKNDASTGGPDGSAGAAGGTSGGTDGAAGAAGGTSGVGANSGNGGHGAAGTSGGGGGQAGTAGASCNGAPCTSTQVCVHPTCGGGAPPQCSPIPDGGQCPSGWTFESQCPPSAGSTLAGCIPPPCTPPAPFCADLPASCGGNPNCVCLPNDICRGNGACEIANSLEVVCGSA